MKAIDAVIAISKALDGWDGTPEQAADKLGAAVAIVKTYATTPAPELTTTDWDRQEALSQKHLKDLFVYDRVTGIVTKKSSGLAVGSLTKMGYLRASVLDLDYMLHRLIWCMETGSFPDGQIDHINGNRSDNRWCNLRLTTNRKNAINKEMHRKGKLPWAYKEGRKWKSEVKVDGRSVYLGLFETAVEAHEKAKEYLTEGGRL